MCNLSQSIENRAIEKATKEATEKFAMSMYENSFSLEQISLATNKSIEEVKKIIEEHEPVPV